MENLDSLQNQKKKLGQTWQNQDNKDFYENLDAEEIIRLASLGGLGTGVDVDLIKPIIVNSDKILEVGAGYGRVLEHILNYGYKGELHAIERNPILYQYLSKKYQSRATLFNMDLFNFQTPTKFNLILWMWSGIFEFTPQEQKKALFQLKSLLDTNGILILDIMDEIDAPFFTITHLEPGACLLEHQDQKMFLYPITGKEIKSYASALNFDKVEIKSYLTSSGKKRKSYILHQMGENEEKI